MIRILICLWLCLPVVAMAQPVAVTSGEHDGFTRLVLDFGSPVDWQLGRTTDGYELRLDGARPSYDLTAVFDLIGRIRLAAAWADPETGVLRIGIGCACHAIPFEFRPGIVVIDLKDGAPPKGSSFEMAFAGDDLPDLTTRPLLRPRPRPVTGAVYDWRAVAAAEIVNPPRAASASLPGTDPGLEPLRSALVQQLSRGATQGVIDMSMPEPLTPKTTTVPSVRTALGELPGLQIGPVSASGMTAEGSACATDTQLDIGSWGGDSPISLQMATASTLIGEFDAPDPAAMARAVRFNLHIGFGAEARQILTALRTDQPDAALWKSMARILDAEPDPAPAFQGMAACDSAAALWALLDADPPAPGTPVNRAAALRSFSALPVHLRRHLGPRLAEQFIALSDPAAAQTVRDAVLRGPGEAGPDIAVMEARLDLQAGVPDMAEARLDLLIETPGPATAEALLALIDARIAQRQPVTEPEITALESLMQERRGSPDEARFAVALTSARAAGGDFNGAFVDLIDSPSAATTVWQLLADTGPDSALLAHAVLLPDEMIVLPAPVAAVLSERLVSLGFADAAEQWLKQVPEPDLVLATQIALQQRDARRALRLMAGSDDPSLTPMRTEALGQLGDDAALANLFAQTPDDAARWRAVARARDWGVLAADGPTEWKAVAGLLDPEQRQSADGGLLAQGRSLLDTSIATRSAVDALLSTITAP